MEHLFVFMLCLRFLQSVFSVQLELGYDHIFQAVRIKILLQNSNKSTRFNPQSLERSVTHILKLAKVSSSTGTSHLSYTTSYKKADSFQITSVDSCNSTRTVVVIASIQTSKEHRNSAPIMPSRWQASYKCSYCNKEYTTAHLLNSNDEKQSHCNCPCCGTYNTPKTICKKTK